MPLSWQKDRVPVKTLFHYYQPDSHGSAVLFPRSRERGPIEAGPGTYCPNCVVGGFRAHVSAAPLKPGCGAGGARVRGRVSALT